MAGQRLFYPWGMHLVAAAITAVLGITPAVSFALMNAACFAITTSLLWRIARRSASIERPPVFAATVPLYGLTPFNFGHLAMLGAALPTGDDGVSRHTGHGPLHPHQRRPARDGLYVLALDSLLGIFAPVGAVRKSRYVLLGVAMAGAAFFYPLHYVGAAGATGAGIAISALRGADRRRVIGAAVAVVAGTLCAMPYSSRSGPAAIRRRRSASRAISAACSRKRRATGSPHSR